MGIVRHSRCAAIDWLTIGPVAPHSDAIKQHFIDGRYLDRRGGDGGYMVIFNGDDLGRWRAHLEKGGVHIAASLAHGDYEGLQLHPRDKGGALLEINNTRGGESLLGP